MHYITTSKWNGHETLILHSDELEAVFLPGLGGNIIRLWDKKAQREVLRTPQESELDYYMTKPYHFGTPMLMPPGRIRRGQFSYAGVDYQFDQNTANNNHSHGLHRTQAWTVTAQSTEADRCTVSAVFRTNDDPNWMRQFSTPLEFRLTYVLTGSKLTHKLSVTNTGNQAAPFGFGTHTWFMIDHEPERWTVKVPVSSVYELDKELIVTGHTLPLGKYEELNQGYPVKGSNLDTAFSMGDHKPEAWLVRDDGYSISYKGNEPYFKHWVLYTRGEADEIICLEPYTWLPDAPNLPLDHDITGIIELQPQQPVELILDLMISYA